jgi:hypothetical protein
LRLPGALILILRQAGPTERENGDVPDFAKFLHFSPPFHCSFDLPAEAGAKNQLPVTVLQLEFWL